MVVKYISYGKRERVNGDEGNKQTNRIRLKEGGKRDTTETGRTEETNIQNEMNE